jgi:DNA-directed RNA polymerase subunit K/omega
MKMNLTKMYSKIPNIYLLTNVISKRALDIEDQAGKSQNINANQAVDIAISEVMADKIMIKEEDLLRKLETKL